VNHGERRHDLHEIFIFLWGPYARLGGTALVSSASKWTALRIGLLLVATAYTAAAMTFRVQQKFANWMITAAECGVMGACNGPEIPFCPMSTDNSPTQPQTPDPREPSSDDMDDSQLKMSLSAETLVESIANVKIGETKSATDQTPIDLLPLPTPGAIVEVDENVIKGVWT